MSYRYLIIFSCFIFTSSIIQSQEQFYHLLDTTVESDLIITKWNVGRLQAINNAQQYVVETIDSLGRVTQLEFHYGPDDTRHLFDVPERILFEYLNSDTIRIQEALHQTNNIEIEAEQLFLYRVFIVSLTNNNTASITTDYFFDSVQCLHYLIEVKKNNPELSFFIVKAIDSYINNLIEKPENVDIDEIPYLNYSIYRFGKVIRGQNDK